MNDHKDRLTRPELILIFSSLALMTLSLMALLHGM